MPARLIGGRLPLLLLVVVAAILGGLAGGFTDLHVYRHAGQVVLGGGSLTEHDPVTGLPFTYPPFAALLLVPVAVVPAGLAAALWAAACVAALCATIAMVLRELGRPAAGWVVAGGAVASLALEPVWQNLSFGQVNLLLMAAVLADLLRPERRWSGVLVGIAVGIKLTPIVFVVVLLLVGRRSMAGRAAASFAVTVAVGFLVAAGSSAAYWGERLVDASRVGPPALAHNQSAYGVLTRLLDREPPALLWLAIAGAIAGAALVLGAWWWRRGDPLLGTCLAAIAMLVTSPIAWSHHWVWAVPLVVVLWARARLLAMVVALVFVARPFVWLPYGEGRELAWSPLQHLVGNAYLWCAVGVVVWAAHAARATTATEPGITVGGQSQESPHGR